MRKSIWFLVIVLLITSGCASIVSKSEYPVSISSEPAGVQIAIENREGNKIYEGKTPATITLKAGAGYFKGETYTVTFKADGYTPHSAQIKRDVDGWYILGNLVFGGLIGYLIVDPATGAMWTLKDLHVQMSPLVSSGSEEVRIIALEDLPAHLRSRMVRVR
jgi:hypothetical protein